jgi:HEPN domain-containing protein
MKPDALLAAQRWMDKAASDLRACRILLAADDAPLSAVCFHAQQAAEKAVKALLTANGRPFPKTHHLPTVVRMLPADAGVGLTLDEQVELTHFAVAPRYPDDYVEIDRALAERLHALAESCAAAASRWLDGHTPDDPPL